MQTNKNRLVYKNYYSLFICSTLLLGSFYDIQGMDSIAATIRGILNVPGRVSTSATRHTYMLFQLMEYGLIRSDTVMRNRTQQVDQAVESHTPNIALCGVAAFSAGLGIYNFMHNADHDKKPEQSPRKCLLGAGLAVFSVGYLYKKYRNAENKRAQRAANTVQAAPSASQSSSSALATRTNSSTHRSTSTTTSTTPTSTTSLVTTIAHTTTTASTSSTSLTALSSSSNASTSTPTPWTTAVLQTMTQTTTTSSPTSLSRRRSLSSGSASPTASSTEEFWDTASNF